MENIINSQFISFMIMAPKVQRAHKELGVVGRYDFFSAQGMDPMVKEYTKLFIEIFDLVNEKVKDDMKMKLNQELWREDIAPKLGSGRIQ